MNVKHPRGKLIRCSQCKYLDLDLHSNICSFVDALLSDIMCKMFQAECGNEIPVFFTTEYCKLHSDEVFEMMERWWKEDIEHECEVFEAKEQP